MLHVAFIGAGALGLTYGGCLISTENAKVTFVVRNSRTQNTSFRIERVNGDKEKALINRSEFQTDIPANADVVVVAVRFDQLLNEELIAKLRTCSVPILVLTPMMIQTQQRFEERLGRKVIAMMPGASAYVNNENTVRYWLTQKASTLIDDPYLLGITGEERRRIEAFAVALNNSGIPCRLETNVAKLNAATTALFFPIVAAIQLAGGIDAVLSNKDLFDRVLKAAKETDALAKRIGKVSSWSSLLTKFIGPFTLKPAIALARKLSPESVYFVETHFGAKLTQQQILMGEEILEIGSNLNVQMPFLRSIVEEIHRKAVTSC